MTKNALENAIFDLISNYEKDESSLIEEISLFHSDVDPYGPSTINISIKESKKKLDLNPPTQSEFNFFSNVLIPAIAVSTLLIGLMKFFIF